MWGGAPQGSPKSATRAIFYKVKTETGPRFLGGLVPPTPWGPKLAFYTPHGEGGTLRSDKFRKEEGVPYA